MKTVLTKLFEGCMVVSSLLLIIGLFTIPTVFYALSLEKSDDQVNVQVNTVEPPIN